jgi:hypothetical protein
MSHLLRTKHKVKAVEWEDGRPATRTGGDVVAPAADVMVAGGVLLQVEDGLADGAMVDTRGMLVATGMVS